MKSPRFALLLMVAWSGASWCQGANPFFGRWRVSWEGNQQMRTADLTIDASRGSWHTLAFSKRNPCLGAQAPVAIVSSSAERMVLKLRYSEAYAGCKDGKVVLQRSPDGTITGRRGENELELSRR